MTGNDRRSAAPMGPPWSLDLLADLHAGALDDTDAADLWPRVRADPQARSVLDALDTTAASLANLPTMRMPEDVATRIDFAIAEESRARSLATGPSVPPGPMAPPVQIAPPAPQQGPIQPPGQVIDLVAARRRRNRTLGWGAGVLTAAAAVLGIAVAATNLGTTGTPGQAAPPPVTGTGATSGQRPPLALTSGTLASALGQASGAKDYGSLDDPATLSGCLKANNLDPNTQPAGGRQVTLDGKQGTLLVLTTGKIGQFKLLVVGPTCSAKDPATLGSATVGGH